MNRQSTQHTKHNLSFSSYAFIQAFVLISASHDDLFSILFTIDLLRCYVEWILTAGYTYNTSTNQKDYLTKIITKDTFNREISIAQTQFCTSTMLYPRARKVRNLSLQFSVYSSYTGDVKKMHTNYKTKCTLFRNIR